MVCWPNAPVELLPNDRKRLLPVKVRAERSRFVFLLRRAGGFPACQVVCACLFIARPPRFPSFTCRAGRGTHSNADGQAGSEGKPGIT